MNNSNIPVQPVFPVEESGVTVLKGVNPSMPNLLSLSDAAKKVGIASPTLKGYAKDGKVRFTTAHGKMYFDPADVEAFILVREEEKRQRALLAAQNKESKPAVASVNKNTVIPSVEEQQAAYEQIKANVQAIHVETGFLAQLLGLTPNTTRGLITNDIIPADHVHGKYFERRVTAMLIYELRKVGLEGLASDSRLQTEVKVAGLNVNVILRAGTGVRGRVTVPLGTKKWFVVLSDSQANELREQGIELIDPYEAQKKYNKNKKNKLAQSFVEDDDDDQESFDNEFDEDEIEGSELDN